MLCQSIEPSDRWIPGWDLVWSNRTAWLVSGQVQAPRGIPPLPPHHHSTRSCIPAAAGDGRIYVLDPLSGREPGSFSLPCAISFKSCFALLMRTADRQVEVLPSHSTLPGFPQDVNHETRPSHSHTLSSAGRDPFSFSSPKTRRCFCFQYTRTLFSPTFRASTI